MNITKDQLNLIAQLMDDVLRERVHSEIEDGDVQNFIEKYVGYDPDFKKIMKNEFNIDWEN